ARLFEMRHVQHLAIEPDGAKPRVLLENVDDAARVGDFLRARAESAVDNLDLRRMDRELADKTHAAIAQAFGLKSLGITEVEEHTADRLRINRPGRRQGQRAREEIGFVIISG